MSNSKRATPIRSLRSLRESIALSKMKGDVEEGTGGILDENMRLRAASSNSDISENGRSRQQQQQPILSQFRGEKAAHDTLMKATRTESEDVFLLHKLQRVNDANIKLREECRQERESRLRAQHALLELKEMNRGTESRLEEEVNRRIGIQESNVTLRRENERLTSELGEVVAQREKIKGQIVVLKEELERGDMHREVKRLNSALDQAHEELHRKSVEIKKVVEHSLSQQMELRGLESTIATKNEEIQNLCRSVDELRTFISQNYKQSQKR